MKQIDNLNPQFATIKCSSLAGRTIPCLFGELNGKRLQMTSESHLPVSTPVTVEYNDALFLGEVVASKAEADVFVFEIKVEQVLSGLQSLMALRSRLLGDVPSATPRVSPLAASYISPAFAQAS